MPLKLQGKSMLETGLRRRRLEARIKVATLVLPVMKRVCAIPEQPIQNYLRRRVVSEMIVEWSMIYENI